MNEKGSAFLGVLVGAAVLAFAAIGYSTMSSNNKKAMRGLTFQMEVANIHEVLSQIMGDAINCTASIKASHSVPPNTSGPVEIDKVIMSDLTGTGWTFRDFYLKGVSYNGTVKIASMKLRPYNASTDPNPGPKFVVTYERVGQGFGAETIAKTMDVRFDTNPLPAFAGYNFSCTTTSEGELNSTFWQSPKTQIDCAPSGTVKQEPIACPSGKSVINCGVRDDKSTDNEDSVTCYLDIPNNRCMFSHELSGNCDEIYGYCYCI